MKGHCFLETVALCFGQEWRFFFNRLANNYLSLRIRVTEISVTVATAVLPKIRSRLVAGFQSVSAFPSMLSPSP